MLKGVSRSFYARRMICAVYALIAICWFLFETFKLDLEPKSTDILIVKIGYLVPELYEIRGDWVMALTPGGVDQDLLRLDYKEIVRPVFPLDTKIDNPDLSAKLIPKSN